MHSNRFLIVLFFFLAFLQFSTTPILADCGVINPSNGLCTAPGGISCGSDSTRCCNPQSDCTTTTTCGNAGQSCCPPTTYPDPCIGGMTGNLSCITRDGNSTCEVCGGENLACCSMAGQSPCGASASLFCNTQTSPPTCLPPVIPPGCTPTFQVCNGTHCTTNPLYCCTDPAACDQIVAPQPPPTGPSPHGTCGESGIQTALGCLDITGTATIATLLSWGTGLAGGIAVLMIIFAGFQITTAAGDPKRIKAGQELITSAIAGLFLIALSVVLLNFIGVNVFGLQDLGFSF